MSMKDLGVKHSHSMAVPSKEESKSYPSVTIDHKAMPHLKKHKVGDTGHMKVKYKVTGQQSYRNGESHTNLDLTHAEHIKGGKEEASDNESAADEAKENKKEKK